MANSSNMKYRKSIIIIILLLVSGANSIAQKWADQGASWTYMYKEDILSPLPPSMPTKWVVAKDSVRMKGKWCSIIHSPVHTAPFDSISVYYLSLMNDPALMAVYQDSGRLYWYIAAKDTFAILYDFNKKAGESWTMALPRCNMKVDVLSIGMDTVNGFPLRSMIVRGGAIYAAFQGKVIEYIGLLKSPRPINPFSCTSVTDIYLEFDTLRCFEDPVIGFVDFKVAPYCDYFLTSIQESNKLASIKISPNPSTGDFVLDYPSTLPATLNIIDITGRIMLQQPISKGISRIETSKWASGIYLYSLWQEGRLIAKGKLLKQ